MGWRPGGRHWHCKINTPPTNPSLIISRCHPARDWKTFKPRKLIPASLIIHHQNWHIKKEPTEKSVSPLKMVGMRGFEPPTPWPPAKCANQAALHPEFEWSWSVCMNVLAVSYPGARMVFKIVDRNGDVNKIGLSKSSWVYFFWPVPPSMIISLTLWKVKVFCLLGSV